MRFPWLYVFLCLSTIAAAADIKAARKAAADRPRPLIFNNDGCDVVYEMKQPTAEDLLSRRGALSVRSARLAPPRARPDRQTAQLSTIPPERRR